MKNENYILICIAILLLAYFLFSGVILEGVNEYTKGTQGTTCDKGRQIDSKANCEDAIKSLGLEAKEWYNDYSEKMPGGCSWTEGENSEKANWNKSVKGAGLAGTFPICIAANENMSPEEAEKELSKRSRIYLNGISDQLSTLGKLRNRKRRTPVNISIDVGAGPGKTKTLGGDEEPLAANEGGPQGGPVFNSPPPAGQDKKLEDAERGIGKDLDAIQQDKQPPTLGGGGGGGDDAKTPWAAAWAAAKDAEKGGPRDEEKEQEFLKLPNAKKWKVGIQRMMEDGVGAHQVRQLTKKNFPAVFDWLVKNEGWEAWVPEEEAYKSSLFEKLPNAELTFYKIGQDEAKCGDDDACKEKVFSDSMTKSPGREIFDYMLKNPPPGEGGMKFLESAKAKKEGFFSFPPTMGYIPQRQGRIIEGFLEGIGNPEKDDFGLQGKSKNSGDIRNYSAFESKKKSIRHQHLGQNPKVLGHQHKRDDMGELPTSSLPEDKLEGWGENDESDEASFIPENEKSYVSFGSPIKEGGESLNCTIGDHRGCRGFDNRIKKIDKDRKKLQRAANEYGKKIKISYELELKNHKARQDANKKVYEKQVEAWKDKKKKLEKESAEKKAAVTEEERIRKEQIEIEKNLQEQERAALNKEIYAEMEEEIMAAEKEAESEANKKRWVAREKKKLAVENKRYLKELKKWKKEETKHHGGMIIKPDKVTKHSSPEVRAMVKDLEREVDITKQRVGKEKRAELHGLQKMTDYEKQQEERKKMGKQTPQEKQDYEKWRKMTQEQRKEMAQAAGKQEVYRQWGGQQGQQHGQQHAQQHGQQQGYRQWGGQQGQQQGHPWGPKQPRARHGIKQIIYDRNQMISPKLQKELGIGVHNTGDAPKQVIREGPNKQSWYAWFFGEPKKIQKSAWY